MREGRSLQLNVAERRVVMYHRWNEWLTLPINYSALPLSAQIALTVWDLSPAGGENANGHAVPFGGTTIRLFDKDNQLQKGRQKCHLHRRRAADGLDDSSTPSIFAKKSSSDKAKSPIGDIVAEEAEEELERLEKLFKKHEMGELSREPWLDQLVFRAIEKKSLQASSLSIRSAQKKQTNRKVQHTSADISSDLQKKEATDDVSDAHDENFVLFIELPRFDFPIVFADHEYVPAPMSLLQHLSTSQSNIILKPPPEVQLGPGINASDDTTGYGGRLVKICDPEVGTRDNPAESKHRRLVRSYRSGMLDKDLKPNAKVRDELNNIITYSPSHPLTPEEKDLVWKFRHHLSRDKRALTKFVKSVNWNIQSESRQAVQILLKWNEVDVDDALELLGPTFDHVAVRAYAVDRLRKADDHELLLYLLQLVQALKFEHIVPESSETSSTDSSLASFLISRATKNFMLGNYLHWYLMVECSDQSEAQGPVNRKLYAKVEYDFMSELVKTEEGIETRKVLLRQGELITILSRISEDIKVSREGISRKVEHVKHYLADPKNELINIDPPLPMPLDPSILITGMDPTSTAVFKSSLFPIMMTFKTTTNQRYQILFKSGDDLRQDQLVIQIITLMDQLLQKENLDLRLSPYRILATGATAGAVQFVHSMSLQSIAKKYKGNSVLAYLKSHSPDDKAALGVRKEALDTFVKSCAGYCVITYLLGVGDRHLDNLLLAPDGHFFHADFGFILGRDPKPFAPAMKLCKEMVDGMGGGHSEQYQQFKQYCFTAYTTLRKSSNLILNLFSLMVDANIPDIRLEPDKVVQKVKERFHLEMSEEDSIRYFERLIEDSASALFPVVIDRLHGIVQNFRG